jgi:hypothetical protein
MLVSVEVYRSCLTSLPPQSQHLRECLRVAAMVLGQHGQVLTYCLMGVLRGVDESDVDGAFEAGTGSRIQPGTIPLVYVRFTVHSLKGRCYEEAVCIEERLCVYVCCFGTAVVIPGLEPVSV